MLESEVGAHADADHLDVRLLRGPAQGGLDEGDVGAVIGSHRVADADRLVGAERVQRRPVARVHGVQTDVHVAVHLRIHLAEQRRRADDAVRRLDDRAVRFLPVPP